MKISRKYLILITTAFIILFSGCKSESIQEHDFSGFFEDQGVEGSFLLYDLEKEIYIAYNPDRCQVQFIPASTFKILNAQIALESGVIQDENEIISWDGNIWPVDSWNQDHDLSSAMKYSVVWYYEKLAERIGPERMQDYLDQVEYGNQSITGPGTAFWLVGDLRISQFEQIEFLKKLYHHQLPFSPETMEIAKELILLEDTANFRLFGKTGWASSINPDVGWFIGYIEFGEDAYFFATNVEKEGSHKSLGGISREITLDILENLGLNIR